MESNTGGFILLPGPCICDQRKLEDVQHKWDGAQAPANDYILLLGASGRSAEETEADGNRR